MARTFMPKAGALMPHIVMNRDAAVAGVFSVDGEAGSIDLTGKYLQISNYNTEREELEIILTGKADAGINNNIKELTGLTEPLSIVQGGTGGNTPDTARKALGAIASVNGVGPDSTTGNVNVDLSGKANNGANSDITSLSGLTTPLSVSQGGTGAKNYSDARDALGLGPTFSPSFSSIELSSNIPFIDFHYGANTGDYTTRLIAVSTTEMEMRAVGSAGMAFRVAGGYRPRAGVNGAFTTDNLWNFDWVGSSQQLLAYVDNSNRGAIAFTSTSDRGLKKDIEYISDNGTALQEVMNWRPANFKMKARGEIPESDDQLGFIANDIVNISRECVSGNGLPDDYNIEENPNGINDAYYLNPIAISAKLTLAIQEQQKILLNQNNIIIELQSRLNILENK